MNLIIRGKSPVSFSRTRIRIMLNFDLSNLPRETKIGSKNRIYGKIGGKINVRLWRGNDF